MKNETSNPQDGKAAPHGSGFKPVRISSSKLKEIVEEELEFYKTVTEDIHQPVKPGILKQRLGSLSCTKVRSARSKLKDKGTHYAKALQRYLNYHCQ